MQLPVLFIVLEAIRVIEFFPVPPPFSFSTSPPPLSHATPGFTAAYIALVISAILFRTSITFRAQFVSPFYVVDSVILMKTIGTFGLILQSLQAFNRPALDRHDD